MPDAKEPGPDGGPRARATMVDVAKRAGVSQATVSLVLNGAGGTRVAAATRKRVLEAADALGYRIWRRSPVGSGALRAVGFLVDDTITHPLVNYAIEGAREAAWENDCVLMVMPSRGDPAQQAAALELLFGQRVLGVVMAAVFTSEVELPAPLRIAPTVLINCTDPGGLAPALIPAHAAGAEAATAHLIAAGHRRIGFIVGEPWMLASRERSNGYRAALRHAGIRHDPRLARHGDGLVSGGRARALELMRLPVPPTAIFCASDRMALGAYEAVKELGLAIPGDVSIVGFDDDPIARFLDPALTTIRVPHEEMGRLAVEDLAARAAGVREGRIGGLLRLDCPLVTRASVARPT